MSNSSVHRSADGNAWQLDMIGSKDVEIQISADGKTIWVNNDTGCILRLGQVNGLIRIKDMRHDT